jgi:hypothetical protein
MAGEPHCAPFNESCKIGEYCLGTRPAAPDAAIQNREEHNTDEEEKKYEQKKVSFTDPDDGAEEVQLERWDIKTEGTFAMNLQKGQTKHQHSLQPCSYTAFDAIGFWYHTGLMGVMSVNVVSNCTDLFRTQLFLEPRHTIRGPICDDADMVGKCIAIDELGACQ